MNKEPPPPIDPSLLDARMKPLVPKKSDKASSLTSTLQRMPNTADDQGFSIHSKVPPDQSQLQNLDSSSGSVSSFRSTSDQDQGDVDKSPSMSPLERPSDNIKTETAPDGIKNKEKGRNPFGLVIGFILTIIGCTTISFFVGRGIAEQNYRKQLAEANSRIDALELKLKACEEDLKAAVVLATPAKKEKKASGSQEFLLDDRAAEKTIEPTKDLPPSISVKAQINGRDIDDGYMRTYLIGAGKVRLPAKWTLTPGKWYGAQKVIGEHPQMRYEGELPGFKADWHGEKEVVVPLRFHSSWK